MSDAKCNLPFVSRNFARERLPPCERASSFFRSRLLKLDVQKEERCSAVLCARNGEGKKSELNIKGGETGEGGLD